MGLILGEFLPRGLFSLFIDIEVAVKPFSCADVWGAIRHPFELDYSRRKRALLQLRRKLLGHFVVFGLEELGGPLDDVEPGGGGREWGLGVDAGGEADPIILSNAVTNKVLASPS